MLWAAVLMAVLAPLGYLPDVLITTAARKPRRVRMYIHVKGLTFATRMSLEVEYINMDVGPPRIWQQAYKQP